MLSVSLLIVASCKKSVVDDPQPEPTANEITINGTVYPTVKIGNQTWTTINYNGSGGVNYNDSSNDPSLGKLYSWPEVKAITNLPIGWRLPTNADVKSLMANVGTKLDGTDAYNDADASKKLMSTTGWNNTSFAGTNTTGLNLKATGYLFINQTGVKSYSDKGVLASFWTSSTIQSGSNSYPLLFEVSTNSYDSKDQPAGLRGMIYNTTANGDGLTTLLAEKRSIRFVKDN